MELTNIAQTEPSASLFVVPAGYTVTQGGGGRGPGGPRGAARRGSRPPVESPYGYSRRTFVLEGAAVIDTDAVEAAKALLPP